MAALLRHINCHNYYYYYYYYYLEVPKTCCLHAVQTVKVDTFLIRSVLHISSQLLKYILVVTMGVLDYIILMHARMEKHLSIIYVRWA